MSSKFDLLTKERFMKYVNIPNDLNNCWEWVGGKFPSGYGVFKANHRNYRAHRFSYLVFIGEIFDDLLVCHSCDNPGCVNPFHLFLGTQQDNIDDKVKKNRQAHTKGEDHWSHKLVEQDIYKIREFIEHGHTNAEIAKMFGVSPATISDIRLSRCWGWLK